MVSGGGNCVTFDEVDELVADVDTDSMRAQVGVRLVSSRLDTAQVAADAGDRELALRELHVAERLSRAMLATGDALGDKIADLSDWQQGLLDAGI